MTTPTPTRLQSLIWPEVGLNTEVGLYFQLDGGATFSMDDQRVYFISGAVADFGTYNNLFNSGKWHTHCALTTLALDLTGAGRFELAVFHARPERSPERILTRIITLTDSALSVNVMPPRGLEAVGLIHFQLTALSAGHLDAAHWQTDDAARRTPQLMLSITSFRREAAVLRTLARYQAFIDRSDIAPHLHLTIVDNGQTLDLPASPHVTVIPNANLGGSGGFARGLLAAQVRGASHCLFMDDDASVHMQAIERTWMFLAYATDTATAVAGAIANAQYRWELWENGALFDRVCHPAHIGLDLREIEEVEVMEFASTATPPGNFYGGWWYFAFPLAHVTHMPFPFFVRGDDVSFSLVHDFNIMTLPGVMSYQDEDFSVKETPLTVYLDLRSHMAHHLALPKMEIGRLGLMKIIARFYMRALLFCHYDTLAAIGLALEDVLAGPAYFAANADAAARRAQIAALTDTEKWRPIADTHSPPPRDRINPKHGLARFAMKLTLNGHLLPGFARFGNRTRLGADQRGQLRLVWGAAALTYTSADGTRSYTARHSKRRALQNSLPIVQSAWQLWRCYTPLRDDWRAGYRRMTTPEFWRGLLGMNAPAPGP